MAKKEEEDQSINTEGMSPIQLAMFKILSDGEFHPREQLHTCLWDERGKISNINPHLTYMRRVLIPQEYDIMRRTHNGKLSYRLVRLVTNIMPY